jgi:hypothetical protein
MGWARMLLLGDLGQQLDIEEARGELDRVRRSVSAGAVKDYEQDERILALSNENEQLKLCAITLVRLLVSRGVVYPQDVGEILNVLDPPRPPAWERNDSDEASTDDLIALAEAARKYRSDR